jgi:hypothetical protein
MMRRCWLERWRRWKSDLDGVSVHALSLRYVSEAFCWAL